MNFKKNVLANYISQFYVTVIGIAMIPLYISYMGEEAYGLVGFFAMLQAWFNMLDLGLTPATARETARFHGGAINVMDYRRLVRALEGIFLGVAMLGGLLLFLLSEQTATRWLNTGQLPIHEVTVSLQIMALIVALRWLSGLYRSIITGSEQLVWLSGFNSLIATLRFILVLPVLIFISTSPLAFFGFQLGVTFIEVFGLVLKCYRLLPDIPARQHIHWEWTPLKPFLKFSLSMAIASSIWILVTQTDKLILSKIMSLADYGYFTVAALVASGIMVISSPVSSAILPRMTRLQSEGQHKSFIDVYRQSTRLVVTLTVPATLILVFFAPQVLFAWTGNAILVEKISPVLSLYAAGYGILAVSAFPYYLQYAKGDLKLHLIGSVLFVVTLIPSVIWATNRFGMTGAGWAWFISNAGYFLAWTPFVHQRFLPRLHWQWMWQDIFCPALLPLLGGVLAMKLIPWANERLMIATELVGLYLGFLVLTLFFSKTIPSIPK